MLQGAVPPNNKTISQESVIKSSSLQQGLLLAGQLDKNIHQSSVAAAEKS